THGEASARKLDAPPVFDGAFSADGSRFATAVASGGTGINLAVYETVSGKKIFSKVVPFAPKSGNDQRTHSAMYVNSERIAVVTRQWPNMYIGPGGAADLAEYSARQATARQTATL